MIRPIRLVGEYFLGTEIRKSFRDYASFCREYFADKDELRKELTAIYFKEIFYLVAARHISNVADAVFLINWVSTGDAPYLILASEGWRLAHIGLAFSMKMYRRDCSKPIMLPLDTEINLGIDEETKK